MTKAQTIKLSKYFLTVAVGLAVLMALWSILPTTPEASAQSDTCTITLQQYSNNPEINESEGPFVIDGTCTTASDYFTYGLWNRTDDTWIIGPTTQWVDSEGYMFSATTDHTFTSLGTKDIEARVSWDASVSFTGWYADRDVATVDVVSSSGGGSGPDANDNGEPGDRICTQVGVETEIDVLANDSGSGSLSIDGITDQANRGTAFVTTDDGYEVIRYTPSATGNDSFDYQISDGSGSTDEATVYTNNTDGCGSVTAQVSGVPDASQANIEPQYDGANLPALDGQQASLDGWNVELDENPRLFIANKNDISAPEGYKILDGNVGWIQKVVDDEKRPEQNIAELGLSYSATPSVCNPPIPTVGSDEVTTINSAGGDNVLITNSSNRSDLIDQCAVNTGRMHEEYTTALDSSADWIWQTTQEYYPSTNAGPDGTVVTFQQQFKVPDVSEVSLAEIEYAADNYYELRVNGSIVNEITSATAESPTSGYETATTSNITSLIEEGTNTVQLEVTNEGDQHDESAGNPAAGIFQIEVDTRENNPPTANFTTNVEQEPYCDSIDGTSVRVDFYSFSNDPDGDPLSYHWDFDHLGNTSTESSPTYYYPGYEPAGGTWDVTLTVSDNRGASDSITNSFSAHCGSPISPY